MMLGSSRVGACNSALPPPVPVDQWRYEQDKGTYCGFDLAIRCFATSRRAADAGRDISRGDDKFWTKTRGDGAGLMCRSFHPRARSRVPRPGRPAVVCHGVWFKCLGPFVWSLQTEGPASISRDTRPASRRLDARRHPLSHSCAAHGSLFRTGDADHVAARWRSLHSR